MKDEDKTKDELMNELVELRQRIVELETSEVQHKQVEKALLGASARLQALQQVTAAVHSTLDLEKVFKQITDGVVHSMRYTTAFILMLNDEKKCFGMKTLSTKRRLLPQIDKILGFSFRDLSFPADPQLNPAVSSAMKGEVVIVKTLAEIAYPWISRKACVALQRLGKTKNYILLPLKVEKKMVGVVFITSPREEVSQEELTMLQTFARTASNAINNASLHMQTKQAKKARQKTQEKLQATLKKLRGVLGATIQAIALTVETRDAYTAGHQRRVTNLARAIATEMKLSKDQIDGIRTAGTIHDIGKIGVPAEILNKPIRLTNLEFNLIKIHPLVGYNILKQIEFPWPVAEIVLQHHERMNGSGYPHGLSDGDILLEARILGVADVVEAMASHRPYRPALGIDEALKEISQNKGVLYDPQVVDACLKLFREKGFKFE